MRFCKDGFDVEMFLLFARSSGKHELDKFILYLPNPSSAETWKIFTNKLIRMLEIIFCAKQELITRARLRVQDFATGKNFSFNQCRYKEFCFFFSRKSCYKSNGKFFFCVCIA